MSNLRAEILEALLGADVSSEESYVDTKAKFLIDDIEKLIKAKVNAALIQENQNYINASGSVGYVRYWTFVDRNKALRGFDDEYSC